MSEFKIEFHARLSESPAAVLTEAYIEDIIAKDCVQTDARPVVNPHSWVSCAMIDGECVGFLELLPYPQINALWIASAYVSSDHRRKGIHSALFRDAVRQAKLEGFDSVECGVHINNKESIAAMAKQGRRVTGHFYSYDIKENEHRKEK